MTPCRTASVLTIVARPVPVALEVGREALDDAGAELRQREVAEPREDPQVEVDRVALLRGEREAALGVVGPPLAVDVLAQRDLVGEQRRVAGLLEPPDAAVEVARVVLDGRTCGDGAPFRARPRASERDRRPCRRRRAPRWTLKPPIAAVRLARTRARSVPSARSLAGTTPASAGGGMTGGAGRRAAGADGHTRGLVQPRAWRSTSSIRSRPPGLYATRSPRLIAR